MARWVTIGVINRNGKEAMPVESSHTAAFDFTKRRVGALQLWHVLKSRVILKKASTEPSLLNEASADKQAA